jgi:hypothetical protein
MSYGNRPPVTNKDGDVRELSAEDMSWFVSSADFPNDAAVLEFLRERSAFFHTAESQGIAREAFLALAPNKPGFIARATAAMEAIIARSTHAAE